MDLTPRSCQGIAQVLPELNSIEVGFQNVFYKIDTLLTDTAIMAKHFVNWKCTLDA